MLQSFYSTQKHNKSRLYKPRATNNEIMEESVMKMNRGVILHGCRLSVQSPIEADVPN